MDNHPPPKLVPIVSTVTVLGHTIVWYWKLSACPPSPQIAQSDTIQTIDPPEASLAATYEDFLY